MSASDPRSPTPSFPEGRAAAQETAKIRSHHRDRLAVVYVRQSTPRQVSEHRESTALQYDLAGRAVELGWPRDRVVVIDEDLGQSARTAEHRVGFQRLLAEVGLDHVGLVLGIEMSRLARSFKDWYQLLELCAVLRVLVADQDGLYDPCDYNDRLLLGLKGTMSEAELHLLRARMEQGKQNKARRGELFNHMPLGYVRSPSDEVAFDPDQQAQAVVRLLFEKFEELGSVRRLLRYLRENAIRLPFRPHGGPQRGQLEWRPACAPTLYALFRNPYYAGAYSYGRSRVVPRRDASGRAGTGSARVPMEQWQVLQRDKVPAYISWEQFLANQQRLRQNRAHFETLGAPRKGPTLLGGLVTCGRCGRRMMIAYGSQPHCPRYSCRHPDRVEEAECQSLLARLLDRLVEEQVLRALQPAALELSLQAEDQIQRERQRLHLHWQQHLERARYQVERARRQYDAVEPENRLVARELEKRWEQALQQERQAQEEYARFRREQPRGLSAGDRDLIRALSADLPALWDAPSTTFADRQEALRQLVQRVEIHVQGRTEVVEVKIHWVGDSVSEHKLVKSVRRYEQLEDYERLVARLRELRDAGGTTHEIAARLQDEGFRMPKRDRRFSAATVRKLLCRTGLTGPRGAARSMAASREPHEWWIQELAGELGVPLGTLRLWCRASWVRAYKRTVAGRRWVIWADADELERLRRLRSFDREAPCLPYPTELVTPKRRPDPGAAD